MQKEIIIKPDGTIFKEGEEKKSWEEMTKVEII